MKRKTFLTIMTLLLTIVMLAACGKGGKHNYSEEWSNDETYHWHACADKGCKELKDKAEHSWNDGSVTVEPTTEKEGSMVFVCTVCRREKTEKIDKLVAEKEYTITFDSKGGSAVQPVKASAGAAITAHAAPTKEGFVFAGWYESADGGETLSDTEFVLHICLQGCSRFTQSGRLPTSRARLSIRLTQSSSGSPKPSSKRFLQKWK